MAALSVREVLVQFGGNRALDDADFEADAGTITGLIGPNGAGKTTMFNVVCGLLKPNQGHIALDGADITALNPTQRSRHGLARTFQRLELFTMLSVRENVQVAVETYCRWSRRRESVRQRVDQLLGHVGLADVADARASSLPTGQGRLLELARALACRPKVLLLDEPAAGQDEAETKRFATLLRQLAHAGIAVTLVEHDVPLVMSVCDRVHVLDFGRMIAAGTPTEVQRDEAVRAAYLGQEAGAA